MLFGAQRNTLDMETVHPYKNQVWDNLKGQYNRGRLFEDPEFPPNDRSMSSTRSPPYGVKWRRPHELIKNPQFVVGDFDRCDMDQGYVGNCWFIAGCVGIMQTKDQDKNYFAKVVPLDQGFDDDYGGIFHFRFWQYGEWIDVVIDDRLPFYPDGKLLYCSNRQEPNEMWCPLLEKAYAKLYGSYEALEGGFTTDALIDMSGGMEESFEIKTIPYDVKSKFWDILYQSYEKKSIIGCSINADPSVREARMSNGLVRGHAYTVTKVDKYDISGREVKLIRIRNPWGNEVEWRGAWSDNSSEWTESAKRVVGMVKDHDGEFWMSYNDFMTNWDTVQICHLSMDGFSAELLEGDDDSDLRWKPTIYHGDWKVGSTAGGCGQPNMAKFWTNPQFLVTLRDVDKDDNENKATVIISLMQKDSRLRRAEVGGDQAEEYIQFRLYKIKDGVEVDENKTTGLRFYSSQLERIGTSGSYINKREVTKRFRTDPGNYIIIPSTYDEDRNCSFLIRIFTETLIDSNPLEEHKDELDENDIFFDLQDADQAFSEWSNLLGDGSSGAAQDNSNPDQPTTVQEQCNIQ